jgi:two-component system chemotaxis response regulator CheB
MIRVLIVDDSPTARRFLSRALSEFHDIEVIGTAPDAVVADKMITAQRPDVMTLDVEMPGIDGLTFLERLLRREPMAVVVLSSLTTKGSESALRALELGAVEVLSKPNAAEAAEFSATYARAIRAAAVAKILRRTPETFVRPLVSPPAAGSARASTAVSRQILCIGASTGGTEAIRTVLRRMPGDTPATVIVQHLPAGFTATFAQRLDSEGPMRVSEARGGEELLRGHVYIAPGGFHLRVAKRGSRYQLEVDEGPREHYQRPAVDVLFRSVAKAAGSQVVGVLLTGMGQDGALGLLEVRQLGGRTFAQDEATCVVYGMPKVAVEKGAVERVLALEQLPSQITLAFQGMANDSPSGRAPVLG